MKIVGLSIIQDFITEEEENEILNNINKKPASNTSLRNSIQRFGPGKSYQDNIVSETIPDFLSKLGQKILDLNLVRIFPTQISINEYHKGQQIPFHIDNNDNGDVVTILSLCSKTTMLFRRGKNIVEIDLPNRSLLQMRDEAKISWSHSIPPVEETRYSIVFRC